MLAETDRTRARTSPGPQPDNHRALASLTQQLRANGSLCQVKLQQLQDAALHPHELFISVVSNRLDHSKQPDWLDVGCGWHFDWHWEQKREESLLSRANVVGIDPDWRALARHRTITRRIVGQVESLPFASGSFDLVTANVVLEHLECPELAFREVFRVLRPGGYFLFRTPSARSYFVRIARVLPQRFKVWLASGVIENRDRADIYPALYRANTPEVIENLCRSVGFQNLSVTITKARGILGKVPALAGIERRAASLLGMTQGNLIVEIQK